MKVEVSGVVGGIVVAMIHKDMFNKSDTTEARRKAISQTVEMLGKSFCK